MVAAVVETHGRTKTAELIVNPVISSSGSPSPLRSYQSLGRLSAYGIRAS